MLWILLALVAVAFSVRTFSTEPKPVPESKTASAELDPSLFRLNGIALETRSQNVHLKWKYLGKDGGWDTFGFQKTDGSGMPYYFLAAKFDAQGFATTLRGTTLGYDSDGSSNVWEKLKATRFLPHPIQLEDDDSNGHGLELYSTLGLAVHELSGDAREYYLIDPTRWNDLRIDNCDLFQNDKARIYLHPQD